MMNSIRNGAPDWTHKKRWQPVSRSAVAFIKKLLVHDPVERLDAQQALLHPWLSKRGAAEKASLSRDCLQSMQHYANTSKAKRAVLQLLAQELAPEETHDLRETFLAIDTKNKGTISLQDFKNAIRTGGPRSPNRRSKRQSALFFRQLSFLSGGSDVSELPSPMESSTPMSPTQRLRRSTSAELDDLFSHLAASGDDEIYYSDFLAATMEARSHLREEAVRATFRRLDADDSGSISVVDLRAVLGATFEGVDVERILADVDASGADGITFDAFMCVLERHDEVPQVASQELLSLQRSRKFSCESQADLGFDLDPLPRRKGSRIALATAKPGQLDPFSWNSLRPEGQRNREQDVPLVSLASI